MKINQDEICHATSKSFHGTCVASKLKMSWVKKIAGYYFRDSFRWRDNQNLTDSLHLGTMRVKQKRETNGTFMLYDVYCDLNKKWYLAVGFFVIENKIIKTYIIIIKGILDSWC